MGRKRITGNDKRLPPYVYPRKDRNCYTIRTYLGKGKRLCSLDASIAEVWTAYEALEQATENTLRWLLNTYNSCEKNRRKALDTQKQLEGYRNSLVEYRGSRGGLFGDMPLDQITRVMIRRYLDKAEKKVGANRHIEHLKAAWNWASQRYEQVPIENPCAKVDMNEEAPRTRMVEDWEYQLMQDVIHNTTRSSYNKDLDRGPVTNKAINYTGYLAIMMEFAYLCRLRAFEVRKLKVSDIQNGCVRIERGKGSKGELTRISPRLQAAINAAKAWNQDAPTPITGAYLLHTPKGGPITKSAYSQAWDRAMKRACAVGVRVNDEVLKLDEPFTFHDLKAKGVTDHTEHESGHLSKKAREIYIRRLQEVDATR